MPWKFTIVLSGTVKQKQTPPSLNRCENNFPDFFGGKCYRYSSKDTRYFLHKFMKLAITVNIY